MKRRLLAYPVIAFALFQFGVHAGYEWARLRGELHR